MDPCITVVYEEVVIGEDLPVNVGEMPWEVVGGDDGRAENGGGVCFFRGKTSTVCEPRLETSFTEEVDQTPAGRGKKRVCILTSSKLFPTHFPYPKQTKKKPNLEPPSSTTVTITIRGRSRANAPLSPSPRSNDSGGNRGVGMRWRWRRSRAATASRAVEEFGQRAENGGVGRKSFEEVGRGWFTSAPRRGRADVF
ncbi:hypothetical protein R6Q59_024160 [Mikania micrantha]